MATIRVSNVEAKADAGSPTIDERVTFKRSTGENGVVIDTKQVGITSVGINTDNPQTELHVVGDITLSGSLSSPGNFSLSSSNFQVNDINYPVVGPLSNRNMVDNGAMVIAQRGTSLTNLTNTPEFLIDRWAYRRAGFWGGNQLFDMTQESSGAPDGFKYFLRLQESGIHDAPGADTYCAFDTRLEGLNVSQAAFGTSAAKDITLSFYARGSVTGTYCVALYNDLADQVYIAEYSLTTNWVRYEVTIPARTVGTWATDNTTGFQILFMIAADSDGIYSGSAGWNTSNVRHTANQSEAFASTENATFDLTGVQLELGSVATPFEHRNYTDYLLRCLRYYIDTRIGKIMAGNTIGPAITTGRVGTSTKFPVSMRVDPDVQIYAGGTDTLGATNLYNNSSVDVGSGFIVQLPNKNGFFYTTGGSGITVGSYYQYRYSADAEL